VHAQLGQQAARHLEALPPVWLLQLVVHAQHQLVAPCAFVVQVCVQQQCDESSRSGGGGGRVCTRDVRSDDSDSVG
jgi:hypothetical protein